MLILAAANLYEDIEETCARLGGQDRDEKVPHRYHRLSNEPQTPLPPLSSFLRVSCYETDVTSIPCESG
jgi:hypothetical protein